MSSFKNFGWPNTLPFMLMVELFVWIIIIPGTKLSYILGIIPSTDNSASNADNYFIHMRQPTKQMILFHHWLPELKWDALCKKVKYSKQPTILSSPLDNVWIMSNLLMFKLKQWTIKTEAQAISIALPMKNVTQMVCWKHKLRPCLHFLLSTTVFSF